MVEALIHSTVTALRQPENEKNGIRKSILEYIHPAFTDDERQETVDNLHSESAETLLEERLAPWLTGNPDRIEQLEDILGRQDGLGILR
ncbi:hypothetical protein CLV84_1668 [Neolewinella xylanilytica]|uniref:Uncharacterized protein n=1 Tax=Neolewinella xylanilytica TaxID=1514080 RepID=A0A2S6IB28_9BACT|nr:hypothetical protein [Neolewinella xylanilytica]PPK88698.1 hypothetical protein CLV84_1668 [Neolewinella xylanilytica]